MVVRCAWVPEDDLLYQKYHDEEWGVEIHNDQKLFEMIILEGAQAGLSWITVLRKRENYREVFDKFDYKKIAKYNGTKIKELINCNGIIRNKLKIMSSITNAKIFIKIQKEFGSFDSYIWKFINNKPIINHFNNLEDIPVKTNLSELISADLKKRGMKFVGPIIIYSLMQAIGMTNDHTTNCFRYNEL